MPLLALLALSCTGPAEPLGLPSRPDNVRCIAPPRPVEEASVLLERVEGARFSAPVDISHDGARWIVVEQAGQVTAFVEGGDTTELLDIQDRVRSGGERGLLAFALHPDWPSTPQAFVHYSDLSGDTTISRFTSRDGETFDPDSEEVLLTQAQPYSNHNGGDIAFGPDGLLYIALGDGGSQGDPHGNGQDAHTLLAAILRIDVDGASPYAIPADNPYADGVEGAPEVWATGLRNPWKIAFDPLTGELWAGDVGQNTVEEVDLIERGGNYGWNAKEGERCYEEDPCDSPLYIDPVASYTHRDGVSVTGGYVYRGASIPGLYGAYVYGDYVSGKLWGVFFDPETGESVGQEIGLAQGSYISSFGQDPDGELILADYNSGRLYRLLPGEEVEAPSTPFPQRLSETGCMDPDDPTQPGPGLLPYAVNHPLWSDGAEKDRYVALPPGTAATLHDSGEIELPVGSVLVKQFHVGGALVETRLYMRHVDGGWAPYTYEWLPDHSDAVLSRAGGLTTLADGTTWDIPSSAQCVACHAQSSGVTLGMELGQLNGSLTYPGGYEANQLETWEHIGFLDRALEGEVADLLAYAPPSAGAEAARAYLHVQCSACHQPGSTAPGDMDLRYDTPLAEMNLCEVEPAGGDMGIEGARLLVPGDPARSMLLQRMASLDPLYRMPPLGTALVDEEGVAALSEWIASLEGCE
ncbi:MAG: PQQ-dependent sugar dehydrogenase [Alphaproteobacteria bacterium]|nr:PQQ-dependent sugar dehydrogenase [Alphaproteobacteria bacterium]